MRSLPFAAAALLAALPAAAQEPSGYVETESGRVEITGGRTFFGGAKVLAPPKSVTPTIPTPAPTQAPAPRPTLDPCRAPRSAYLRQLLRATGVYVEDPIALLDGLAGPRGYEAAALFTPYGLLPGIDPIRPLAWDFELQSLARELARCGRAAR